MNEKTIFDYASQMLSALSYLHSKKFVAVPGEINSNRVFLTQMYDTIYVDVGRNGLSIDIMTLTQKSKELLQNRKWLIHIIFFLLYGY